MAELIDRRVAIKAIEDLQDCYNGFSDTYDKACIIGVLEELPSVQPQRKGKWIEGHRMKFDGTFYWYRECDQCGYERGDDNTDRDSSYCPYCGAEMQKGEEDDT